VDIARPAAAQWAEFNLAEMLKDLIQQRAEAKLCTTCLARCGLGQGQIIEVLDKDTKNSLKQTDGSFLIETKRGTAKTLLTVLGRAKGDPLEAPYRNAWLYVNPPPLRRAHCRSSHPAGT
jgi:hypothetical protein